MSIAFSVEYPPWALSQERGDALSRVLDEVGPDILTIPAVSGPLTRLGPTYGWFHTDGGWHYPPDSARYRGATLRPHAAGWFGRKHFVRVAAEAAGSRGVKAVLRLGLSRVPALIHRYAHIRARNAWDAELPWACTHQPEWRELLRETMAELSDFDPLGFVLDDVFLGDAAAAPAAAWNPLAAELASICLCPTCRQRAADAAGDVGGDADAIARSIRTHFSQALSNPDTTARRIRDDGPLSRFVSASQADVRRWLAHLSDARPQQGVWVAMPEPSGVVRGSGLRGSATDLLHETGCGWWRRMGLAPAAADVAEEPFAAGSAISVPAWLPDCPDSESLVRSVREYARRGASIVNLTGLADAADEAIAWARQAVRYARRG